MLLDPNMALQLQKRFDANAGLLLAYEKTATQQATAWLLG